MRRTFPDHSVHLKTNLLVSFLAMPSISALIHACNDEHSLGRTLETLRPCDEMIVIDHDSKDGTVKVAHQYGANVIAAVSGVEDGAYAVHCSHDWVLCLRPDESISERLETALFDWKDNKQATAVAFSIPLREETQDGWHPLSAETRLVNRQKINWQGAIPPHMADAEVISGDILRLKPDV
jgi:glycosyltransferase involved in cell wall biosynthesis